MHRLVDGADIAVGSIADDARCLGDDVAAALYRHVHSLWLVATHGEHEDGSAVGQGYTLGIAARLAPYVAYEAVALLQTYAFHLHYSRHIGCIREVSVCAVSVLGSCHRSLSLASYGSLRRILQLSVVLRLALEHIALAVLHVCKTTDPSQIAAIHRHLCLRLHDVALLSVVTGESLLEREVVRRQIRDVVPARCAVLLGSTDGELV